MTEHGLKLECVDLAAVGQEMASGVAQRMRMAKTPINASAVTSGR